MFGATENRLSSGPYEGLLVKEAPNDYLKTLALSDWVLKWEPDIHAEAVWLCKQRGLFLSEDMQPADRTEDLIEALEMGVGRLYRKYALELHPDRRPDPEEAMKALSGFWKELKVMLGELRSAR